MTAVMIKSDYFRRLYEGRLSPIAARFSWLKLPPGSGARTLFRLSLWAVLFYEFTLIHCFGTFTIMKQEIFLSGSRLEIEYQRRENLLPRLQTITKAYSKHELGLMNYVSDARALGKYGAQIGKILGPEKSAQAGKVLAGLVALAEQYPDLKADQSYRALMEKTVDTENRVAAAREEYNARINKYNLRTRTFPYVIYARWFKLKPMDVYQPEKDPKPMKVDRYYFVY